ncbi:hypothetical protein P4361_05885 [Fictibacillus sp. B-59209]|uniref:hypothetical protein n=1 Tax=Fictibacillus sp. B-59209 TaxID=3024873 RepID=UPI002E1B0ACB|nr:hypothetical protein [Fictibacillus sp. B-59209]
MNIWVEEIIEVLKNLGESATLNEIYSLIEKREKLPLKNYVDWKSVVRKNIYKYSSECDIYSGVMDIFYSVDGKGKGIWGLRKTYPSILFSKVNHGK